MIVSFPTRFMRILARSASAVTGKVGPGTNIIAYAPNNRRIFRGIVDGRRLARIAVLARQACAPASSTPSRRPS